MATNSGRGNQIGATEGPSKGDDFPPPISKDVKESVIASQTETGLHAAGQDAATAPDGETKVKSAEELERERKKAEKNANFAQKQKEKEAAAAAVKLSARPKKEKVPKPVEEPLPEYIKDTPIGEKNILKSMDDPHFKAYNP
ncbi:hypothetical protein BKA67DRAFT_653186 [Truncatella angustata]|uniref:Uncharacterized protein n=1 Tax=Truncatella angustata TaxID=152316 RepID=A0A9P8UXH9_9PEZI|nr:uncharacterized protein BKA67DRAFT_653186 [Truncatella angustata]KAH6659985.1 hypothetical protein BKA67DRAFT_653186 [Truncatella angustata]